ncbi:MAG: hypothetical protein ACYCVH_04385 [Ignavibacteriaceae bacterium]
MRKIVQPIRNLETIEEELKNSISGVLSFYAQEEKIVQLAVTYIYLDKNVYIFFPGDDELFDKINLEVKASFTVLRNSKSKKRNVSEIVSPYCFLSVSIKGFLKRVDEQKLMDDLVKNYLKKYMKEITENADLSGLDKAFFIDTEEIQAFEETGG